MKRGKVLGPGAVAPRSVVTIADEFERRSWSPRPTSRLGLIIRSERFGRAVTWRLGLTL